MQNLVRLSADLARDLRKMLEKLGMVSSDFLQESRRECVLEDASMLTKKMSTCQERQKIVESATKAVWNRHAKALYLFPCLVLRKRAISINQTPFFSLFFKQMGKTLIQPLNMSSLLDSICWTISEPISTASVFIDSFSDDKDITRNSLSAFFDAKTKDSSTQSMRLLTERFPCSSSLYLDI